MIQINISTVGCQLLDSHRNAESVPRCETLAELITVISERRKIKISPKAIAQYSNSFALARTGFLKIEIDCRAIDLNNCRTQSSLEKDFCHVTFTAHISAYTMSPLSVRFFLPIHTDAGIRKQTMAEYFI